MGGFAVVPLKGHETVSVGVFLFDWDVGYRIDLLIAASDEVEF